ncbi:hypothetical protein [Parasitella parasitica]|uniref:Uncharacterized protein n=1 Tax=Parasitella parasitica TaxID=35722 RepID=A0A0B7NJ53_9FUNG|nr:hypothetical protein [Parasitella parasitica]
MVSKSTISLLVTALLSTVSAKPVIGVFYINGERKLNVFGGECYDLPKGRINTLENRIVGRDLWVYKEANCEEEHLESGANYMSKEAIEKTGLPLEYFAQDTSIIQDTANTYQPEEAKSYKFHIRKGQGKKA